MKPLKSQTATEYLIITAVVIIIALIVVNVLGGIPGLGSGISEQQARLILQTQTIGISDYAVSDYDTVFTLTNTNSNTVRIDSVVMDDDDCLKFSSFQLRTGQSRQVMCENIYSIDNSFQMPIVIEWTDVSTSSSYTQQSDDVLLVGSTASKYMSIITANQYWNATSGTGCFDASQPNIPLCTCHDLNEVRTELEANYSLQNNIDFLRCNQLIQSHSWNTGEGWIPIGVDHSNRFQGSFDGQNNFIANVFIDRDEDNQGLFGVISKWPNYLLIQNLGIIKVNIKGNRNIGAIGGGDLVAISNSYVYSAVLTSSGSSGGNYIGGLLWAGYYANISDSYVDSAIITSNNGDAGGLLGYGMEAYITNSYSRARVYGAGSVGGLVGTTWGVGVDDITENSYWYNYTDDDADECVGDDDDIGTCYAVDP